MTEDKERKKTFGAAPKKNLVLQHKLVFIKTEISTNKKENIGYKELYDFTKKNEESRHA